MRKEFTKEQSASFAGKGREVACIECVAAF